MQKYNTSYNLKMFPKKLGLTYQRKARRITIYFGKLFFTVEQNIMKELDISDDDLT